jgi:hypothetical protein
MESEIYIDTSKVPLEIQCTRVFRAALSEMRTALSEPSTVMASCIHEAGHYWYFLKMGVPVNAFTFRGPRFRYLQGNGKGKIHADMAAVEADLSTVDNETFEKGEHAALALGKAITAGDVYTRRLTSEKATTGGDRDRYVFQVFFRDLCKRYPWSLREGQEPDYWDSARAEVLKDLASPETRAEAWTVAHWLRPLLFQPRTIPRLIANNSHPNAESTWRNVALHLKSGLLRS